jgi:hypothetical protein
MPSSHWIKLMSTPRPCASEGAHDWVADEWRACSVFAGNDPWLIISEICTSCGATRPTWREPTEAERARGPGIRG